MTSTLGKKDPQMLAEYWLHKYMEMLAHCNATRTITKADIGWILTFVDNYEALVEEYPELFKESDIDDMKIVRQLLKEKLL